VLPRDASDSRFILSFSTSQVAEYSQFFKDYGFVVINNVLSDEQVQATVNEIWNEIEYKSELPHLQQRKELLMGYWQTKNLPQVFPNRNDPTTWEMQNGWPVMAQLGLLVRILIVFEQNNFDISCHCHTMHNVIYLIYFKTFVIIYLMLLKG